MATLKNLFFLFIYVAICGTVNAQTTVAAGDILITFPLEPEKIEDDSVTEYRFFNSGSGYLLSLTITHSDAAPDEIFEKEISQKQTSGADKKILKTIDVKLGQYTGKEIYFTADLGGHIVPITCRLFVIGNTVYWLDIIDVFGADLYSTIGKDFFDSVILR